MIADVTMIMKPSFWYNKHITTWLLVPYNDLYIKWQPEIRAIYYYIASLEDHYIRVVNVPSQPCYNI